MKIIKYAFAIILIISMASCTVTRPYAVTNNPIGTKVGSSTNPCLSFFNSSRFASDISAYGLCLNNANYGIQQSAKNAGITKVGAVDLKTRNVLIMHTYTLIVYGE
jgi:hypothetical protein